MATQGSVQWICGSIVSIGVTGAPGTASAMLNFRFPESAPEPRSFYIGAGVNTGAFAAFAEIATTSMRTGQSVAVGYVPDAEGTAWAHILNLGGPADTCHVLEKRGKELEVMASKMPK